MSPWPDDHVWARTSYALIQILALEDIKEIP